ncbi:Sip1-related alpha-galactosidase [Paenibacillus thermotolerans]|uniref:Sip1-related alpha-galactosidase n=1 Tax=Paenibacillus thermotolerans TaxID=3027807 RepID=UPI002368F0FC|nr:MULTISPECIES: Sip1-related alpha-galactosidase [unclassified Paenibacillus]
MFRFVANERSVAFEHKEVLAGIEAFARLHTGEEVPLCLSSAQGMPGSFRLSFEGASGKITMQVSAETAGDALNVFVDAAVYNKELFRDRVAFAPVSGIVIRVKDIPGIEGLAANVQHKDWWTRPHFDTDIRKLPSRTLSLLWQADGGYYQLLPVSGGAFRTDLSGGESGLDIRISAYQGGFERCVTAAFVLGRSSDPYALAESCVRAGLEACGSAAKPRAEKTYPEILEYLGWCSWDAFYTQVNAEGLLEKAGEFAAAGLPVRWVMIDDGWSEISADRRLRSYDAAKEKFPDGLAPVIRDMKRRFGIRWVGVWHTIAGYWGGVDPEGELFRKNGKHLFKTNGGAWIPAPDAADAFGFWNDWHGYLKRQGVDFVKVDSQSAIVNFTRDHVPVGEAARAAHTALEASVGLYFGGCVINCMGMAAENVWHRPASSVSRSSDDFVPQEPAGFREHALQNAYNSLFHGPFYWGDWDMYWSDNHDAKLSMALRAVSGGPVYVSDKVGGTNAENVWPLHYRDGRIIRCDRPGVPTADCLTVDPVRSPVPLKVWNRSGANGVIAAFHLYDGGHAAEGSVGASDVPGLEGERFWLYEHFSGRLVSAGKEERMPLRLERDETAFYALIPQRGGGAVTPIGLVDKLVPGDAVTMVFQEGGRTLLRVREGGRFAFASERKPESVRVNGTLMLSMSPADSPQLFVVDCTEYEGELFIEIVC